jgi:hypothetical protein
MGAQNVALVFTRWGHLHHAPFRAFIYMAHRSLDGGNPPQYWGGREEIAMALGRPIPEPYGDDFEKKRKADFEAVKKVIETLTKRGAISLAMAARPGRHAVYTLHLRTGDGGNSLPPSGGNSLPRMVGTERADGGNSVPPRGERGVVGLTVGVDGRGDQQPAGLAHAHANSEDHPQQWPGEFDYQSASLFLLTLNDETRATADAAARADLPGADREQQIIHAAEIAFKETPS